MDRCFVIQPFNQTYDERFEDIFKPAIEAAGLEAYRTDQDPAVQVPIEAIEEGIRSASICLAEITTDNPNVWYELGFAFASKKPVIMVCSDERTERRFPFDIQHRTILTYTSKSPRGFSRLAQEITRRISAVLESGAALREIAESDQVEPVEGLSQVEIVVLAAAASHSTGASRDLTPLANVKRDAEKSGLSALGFALGLRRLEQKSFVHVQEERNGQDWDDTRKVIRVEEEGWDWINRNEAKFVLKRVRESEAEDDKIPF